MSVTLANLRERVAGHLRDVDNRKSTYQPQEIDLTIIDALISLESMLPAPTLYAASALTIPAGGWTFSLPTTMASLGVTGWGSAEYRGDVRIRRRETGHFLTRAHMDVINRKWNWIKDGNYLTIPLEFALWVDHEGTVQGKTWPGCAKAEVCDLYVNVMVDDLRDYVGSGSGTLDTVSANLSRLGEQALVYKAAAQLLAKMSDDDAVLRKVSKSILPLWQSEADKLAIREAARRSDLEEVGTIERWVP